MTKVINANGTVISNEEEWFYQFFDMPYISPKLFDDAMADGDDLIINVNSGGGDVFAGNEIYTKLCMYSGKVTINVVSLAASAASLIAMAGDEVNISPVAQIMIHNVWSMQSGDFHDMDKASEILQKANDSLANAYAKKTGKSKDEVLNMMDSETWLTADEAVENNFADAVIGESEEVPKLVASNAPVFPKKVIQKVAQLQAENKRLKAGDLQTITIKLDNDISKFIEEKIKNLTNMNKSEKSKSELGFSDFVY